MSLSNYRTIERRIESQSVFSVGDFRVNVLERETFASGWKIALVARLSSDVRFLYAYLRVTSNYLGAVARAERAARSEPREVSRSPESRRDSNSPPRSNGGAARVPVISRNPATANSRVCQHSRCESGRVASSDASAWDEGVAEGAG